MTKDKRLLVINRSIFIERLVSATLSGLLDVDLETSKTLGNKSSALSFRQKLDLLTDIRATDKTAITKFEKFAEIRNQFAHNFDVNDFKSCFSFIDGLENFLRKNYKIDNTAKVDEEEQLSLLYDSLFNDVVNYSHEILEKMKSKFYKIGKEQGEREVYEFIVNSIKELAITDSSFNENYYSKIMDEAEKKFIKPERTN